MQSICFSLELFSEYISGVHHPLPFFSHLIALSPHHPVHSASLGGNPRALRPTELCGCHAGGVLVIMVRLIWSKVFNRALTVLKVEWNMNFASLFLILIDSHGCRKSLSFPGLDSALLSRTGQISNSNHLILITFVIFL